MCDTQTNLVRRKERVSCLVLICFAFLCIRSSALPAKPLPVVSGKPHGAITYSGAQLSLDTNNTLAGVDSLTPDSAHLCIRLLLMLPQTYSQK